MQLTETFKLIENRITEIFSVKQKPIRIAINGIEGTGKTVFADHLTKFLKSQNKQAIQVSIDGFHHNKKHRYQQGRDSAKGYYEDSYDEISFVEKVLIPSQNENPEITIATHDLESDEYLDLLPIQIENYTVLITDGAYLFKPNYINHWDIKIYLKTDFETAMNRGVTRDAELLGGISEAKMKYKSRYHKALKIYINENNPENHADVIIDNTEFENLRIIKS